MAKDITTRVVTAQITVELPRQSQHSDTEIINVLKVKSGDNEIKVIGVIADE